MSSTDPIVGRISGARAMEDLMQRRTLLASLAASALLAPTARAAGFVTTRDKQRLAYLDRGTGAPAAFLHGWSLGSAIWTLQTARLVAHGLRVLAHHTRRHAGPDQPGGGYD